MTDKEITLPRQFGCGLRAKAESNGTALLLKKTLTGFFCVPSCRKGTRLPPAGQAVRNSYAQEESTHTGGTRAAPARRQPDAAASHHPTARQGVESGNGRTGTHLHTKGGVPQPTNDPHKLQLFIYPTALVHRRVPRPARGVPRTDGAAPACPLTSPARPRPACPTPHALPLARPGAPRRRTDRRQGVFPSAPPSALRPEHHRHPDRDSWRTGKKGAAKGHGRPPPHTEGTVWKQRRDSNDGQPSRRRGQARRMSGKPSGITNQ